MYSIRRESIPEVLLGIVLEGTVLEGTVLEAKVLEGTVLKGKVLEGVFKVYSLIPITTYNWEWTTSQTTG